MKKLTWKWAAWTTTLVCMLALAGMIVTGILVTRYYSHLPERLLGEAIAEIRTNGISEWLPSMLERAQRPKGWRSYYVQEDPSGSGSIKIVAAYPKDLVGDDFSKISGEGTGIRVTSADGKNYTVWYFHDFGGMPEKVARAADWLAPLLLGLAWIMLAVGIFLEARERGHSQPYAWLLLSLATGPAGLAAWLISRPAKAEPIVCPGCGAEPPKDAAFCATCGHGLKPTCPECRRSVQEEWLYCCTCGTSLAE